ncbi:hypothetical protein K0651_06635 [Ornithinimicrobium sp. Arc0846-15]|nr:hypothetical protein [Ornithinimicrobium laminariae]
MKRTPALLAAPLMFVAFAACGSDETTQVPADSAPAASAPVAAEPATSEPADEAEATTDNAEDSSDETAATVEDPTGIEVGSDVLSRADAIAQNVTAWQDASTLGEAQMHAEAARNLVVGPDGPYYGDADGDGVIAGANDDGLLPGLEGQGGLALSMADNEIVERDVLGGSWGDPAQRWEILDTAINEWTPTNNPYPTLPSHPQRVVGWATLALDAENLGEAYEYAGHAQIHVDVTALALAPM